MFSFAFKQLTKNWVINLASLLGIMFSATIMLWIVSFLGQSIESSKYIHDGDMFAISGSVFGNILMLVVFMMCVLNSLIMKLQQKELQQLRVIGFTPLKIKNILFWELIIISIPAVLAGVGVGNWLDHFVNHFLIRYQALPVNFDNEILWTYDLASGLGTILVVIIPFLIAVKSINKISIAMEQNPFEVKQSKRSKVIKILIGLIAFAGMLALLTIEPLQKADLGSGMSFVAMICYWIAFGCIGSYFIKLLLLIGVALFQNLPITNIAIKSIQKNAGRLNLPITLFIIALQVIVIESQIMSFSAEILAGESDSASLAVNNLIATIIAIYAFGISIFGLIAYIFEKKEEVRNLRLIGFTNGQVIKILFFEAFIIIAMLYIFGLLPIILVTGFYTLHNGLGFQVVKDDLTFSIVILVVPVILVVTYLLFIVTQKRNHK